MTDSATPPRPRRRWALALGSTLLAVIVLELVLQFARAAYGTTPLDEVRPAAAPGEREIWCVGDSHTFGLKVARYQAYPARLEHQLNHGHPEPRIHVRNLGTPGHNIAQVYHRLRRALERGRPDLVIALAGFNDSWNPSDGGTLALSEAPQRSWLVLPRLLTILVSNLDSQPVEHDRVVVEGDDFVVVGADGVRSAVNDDDRAREDKTIGQDLTDTVETGLRELVALCHDAGVGVILMTYASELEERFLSASAGARLVAQDGVPSIDLAAWFREHLDLPHEAAFQPDGHPTAAGYARVATRVELALREFPATADWPFGPGTSAAASQVGGDGGLTLSTPVRSSDGSLQFAATGPAHATYQLYLSLSRGSYGPLGLAPSPLIAASIAEYGLSGAFAGDGSALVHVPASFLEPHRGQPLFAQLAQLSTDPQATAAEALLAASDVVELSPD